MSFLKTNCFSHLRNSIGYVDNHYHYVKYTKQLLCTKKIYSCVDYNNKMHLCTKLFCSREKFTEVYALNVQHTKSLTHLTLYKRKFCTKTLPKDSDVFGDLAYEKYEKVEMDEAEEKEEKYAETVVVDKRERFTYKDYCALIKTHLRKKNLPLALSVLDLMKENGTKPTIYIYRLIITEYARQGDLNQCFKLFKAIRDRGLNPHPAIYNILINACAETDDTKGALERLSYLREYFYKKQINLNYMHYTSLIKAYSRHNQVELAFQIADEARDKHIDSTDIAAALFHATISDKENGLKYALILWHKMKITRIKPNLYHYNLLLKAIKDTKLGDLKVNDILIPGTRDTQILLTDKTRPDLLDSPPVLSTSLIPKFEKSNNPVLNNNTSELDIINEKKSLFIRLNDILEKNRLILFGGIDRLLKRMKDDGVQPNIKTIMMILELLPPTILAEEHFLDYIMKNNIEVDIDFFNMLIKKRCKRKQYKFAKEVLNNIQKQHLTPNIFTFGVLAVGCIKYWDGKELLEQMDNIGYAPNYVVLQTLLFHACYYKDFKYVLYLMKYISHNKIKPSEYILNTLEKFDEIVLRITESEGKYSYRQINQIRKGYNNFKISYENWKENVQRHFSNTRK